MDDLGVVSGARIDWNAGGVVRAPDQAHVRFMREPKLMVAESEMQGKPVWRDIDIAYIHQPGDKDPVRREIGAGEARARWPEAWKAYEEGRKDVPDGIMLSVLFPSKPAIVKNLQEYGIHTVEQLQAAPDSAMDRIPMGGTLKEQAKKYMESVKGSEGFNKMQAQMDKKDDEIRSMRSELDEMKQMMAAAMRERDKGAVIAPSNSVSPEVIAQIVAAVQAAQPEKRGPGRPPKTEN